MRDFIKKLSITATATAFFAPIVVHAQQLSDLTDFVEGLDDVVNTAIPVASALALLAFFFGLAKYIFQAESDEDREQAKSIMIWGVIALFLIAAVGGIIEAIAQTAGVETGQEINRTEIDSGSSGFDSGELR